MRRGRPNGYSNEVTPALQGEIAIVIEGIMQSGGKTELTPQQIEAVRRKFSVKKHYVLDIYESMINN